MSPTTGRTNWKQERRRRAFELRALGWTQQAIAEALGVSGAAVSKWFSTAADGDEPWRGRLHPGRASRLSDEQLRLLPDMLSHGAEAYGFLGDVWTCSRVAVVLRLEFGVAYHKAHVSRLLKRLRWTPQIPIERADQRDDEEVDRWRRDRWPELKKRQSAKG
jgi:transposase